jgi:hypothetical protein
VIILALNGDWEGQRMAKESNDLSSLIGFGNTALEFGAVFNGFFIHFLRKPGLIDTPILQTRM